LIYLTGFMGSGKTTVGDILAGMFKVPFIDMDATIATQTGSRIVDIFKYAGEKAFRVIEQDVLSQIATGGDAVVATGGGLAVDPANRALMKSSGVIVYLRTALEALKTRVGDDPERPLWNKEIERLYEAREDAYADADLIVDTDGLEPTEVARSIHDKTSHIVMPEPVALKQRPYPIYIGNGILPELRNLISRHLQPEGLFVLIDRKVHGLYARQIETSLSGIYHHIMEIPGGEGSKSYGYLEEVLGRMLQCGMNRAWACLAVGGGVIGDLAGFASDIFMRGIPVIQVPTTLLAQVDASIGGKTAINHDLGKNLIGTFHQPLAVLCDSAFFATLDPEDMKGGLAEVIKYGVIMDTPLFEYLEGSAYDYEKIVRMCCRDKALVVARDEREGDLRRILNFGHTLGHALEKCMSFRIHHGQAVAFGMLFATWLSHDMGLLAEEDMRRITGLIERHEIIPTALTLPESETIGQAMAVDKKAFKDGINFILISGIGIWVVKKLPLPHILDAYARFSSGYKKGV